MNRIPVLVITGFLGAGKTTLLNRLLSQQHGRRYAVIVNEFGEIGIDAELIVGADEDLIELSNGCVCCTVRGDLVRTIHGLLRRAEAPMPFDAIVIETTGLAVPAPVAQTFLVDRVLLARTALDSVTVVVDARHVQGQLAHSREAAEQIAFADQIVLNKCDLVDAATLIDVEARLRGLNPDAPVQRAQRASLDVTSLIGRGSFDLARLGDAVECAHGDCDHDHASAVHEVSTIHHDDVRSVSLRTDRPLDMDRLQQWLESLLQRDGDRVLRTKGVLCVAGDERRFVLQAVHRLVEGDWQRVWRDDEVRCSRLVFIGRGLDAAALQTALEGCAAAPRQETPHGRIQQVWPHDGTRTGEQGL